MGLATMVDGRGHFDLSAVDPRADGGIQRDEADEGLRRLSTELRELQELMFAAKTHAILVILQGMDAAGKDVTIRNVFSAANPQACKVQAFSEPSKEEQAHHFLWRADQATPPLGELMIFDRSFYEQLVLGQVNDDVSEQDLRRRFAHTCHFEQILADHGTILFKVFLHVSKDEQWQRLEARQDNPETAWKISPRDWQARQKWDAYMAAYETTIQATAVEPAPWYVVPSDHQWFHNLAVAEAIVQRLRPYRAAWTEARNRKGAEKAAEAKAAQAESGGETSS
ncbi:MAG TPA: PPK2 family polyphosphate kinase [Thermomicrobiales bacterium]|nr:PPK2 family polyphosphate kinase [Thermomicrobiales bacterium]